MKYIEPWFGDSITSGYNDHAGRSALTNKGVAWRSCIDQFNTGVPFDRVPYNVGCSGLTVAQYCKRAMAFARHGSVKIEAINVSIWSPNVPSNASPAAFAANLAALLALEAECISQGVLFKPFFIYPSPYSQTPVRLQAIWDNTQALKARWPHQRDLFVGTPWQDPAVTTTYKFADGVATGDGTHPTTLCYADLAAQEAILGPTSHEVAKGFYGFAEAP